MMIILSPSHFEVVLSLQLIKLLFDPKGLHLARDGRDISAFLAGQNPSSSHHPSTWVIPWGARIQINCLAEFIPLGRSGRIISFSSPAAQTLLTEPREEGRRSLCCVNIGGGGTPRTCASQRLSLVVYESL